MESSQLDHLDAIAEAVLAGDTRRVGPLSTGEQLYVALAANDGALLDNCGYTIAQALDRIGPEWAGELVRRWRHRDAQRR